MSKLSYRANGCLLFILACIIGISSFSAAHAASPDFRFAVLSDHKSERDGLDAALKFIRSQNVDIVIVPGDFNPIGAAYKGYYKQYGYEIIAAAPNDDHTVYFSLGNHDHPPKGDDYFQSKIAPYFPDNGPAGAPAGTIFSFDKGDAHFVVTNPYWNYDSGGYSRNQLEWLAQDLAGSMQPFKFVFGHEPAFPLARHVGNSLDANPSRRDEFWEILSENNVQAFFCGHTHHLSVQQIEGVYQIDSGIVENNHITLVIVDMYPDEAMVTLFETERFQGRTPVDIDIEAYETFRMRIPQEQEGALEPGESRTLFGSSIVPEKKSDSYGCFIEALLP